MNTKTIWTIVAAGAAGAAVVFGVGAAVIAIADPFDSDDTLTGDTLDRASAAALAAVGFGTVIDAQRSDDLDHAFEVEVRLENGDEIDVELDDAFVVVRVGDRDITSIAPSSVPSPSASTTASAAPAPTASGAPVSEDTPLTEQDRVSASASALAAVGSGTVTDIDRSDDPDHAFEVEVTLGNGNDVDVELDAAFTALSIDNVPVG